MPEVCFYGDHTLFECLTYFEFKVDARAKNLLELFLNVSQTTNLARITYETG